MSRGDSRSKPLDGETEEAGRAAISVARHTTTPEALVDYTRRADPAPIPSHVDDLGANPAPPQEIQPARAARGDRDHELSPTRNSPTPFAPSSPPVPGRAAEARQISGDTSTAAQRRPRADPAHQAGPLRRRPAEGCGYQTAPVQGRLWRTAR